jgi:hypothetical protein
VPKLFGMCLRVQEPAPTRRQAATASPKPRQMCGAVKSEGGARAPSSVAAGGSRSAADAWNHQSLLEELHLPPTAPTSGDTPLWVGSPPLSVACQERQSAADLQCSAVTTPRAHLSEIIIYSHAPAQLPAPETGGWFQQPRQVAPPGTDSGSSRPSSRSYRAPSSPPAPSPSGEHVTSALAGHTHGWSSCCDAPPAARSCADHTTSRQYHEATTPGSAACGVGPCGHARVAVKGHCHPGIAQCSSPNEEEAINAPFLGWYEPAAEHAPGLHLHPATAQSPPSPSCCSSQLGQQQVAFSPQHRLKEHQPPLQHDLHAGQGEGPLLHRLAAMEAELKHFR